MTFTFQDLLGFGMFVIALISLVLQAKDKEK